MVAILTISLAFMSGGTTDAFAVGQLKITADVDDILPNDAELIVMDNGPNDLNGALGRMAVLTGPLGCLSGTLDGTISKPVQGGVMIPTMDLVWSVDTTGVVGPCHMTVEFTDTGFTAGKITIATGIGGTTEGQVMYDAFLDPSDVAFGHAETIFSDTFDPFPLIGFNSEGSQLLNPDGDYSLSLLVTIWHDGDEISSGNAFLEGSPPVEGMLMPIDTSALYLAGLGSVTMWMIPAIAGMAGAAMYFVKFRKQN